MKKGTNTTALGDIVDLVMGQAPSSKDTNFEGRGTPFVKVGEFGPIRPVIREWTTNPLRMARGTDVLLCVVGATCGKINLGKECAIGRSVVAIRPHPSKLDQFYLYYFMMTLVERLRSGSVGAAQPVISKNMVGTVQIPIPPLPEQQRIVSILDKALDGIAAAKVNAEKNLKNAREIFESYLHSVFANPGEDWEEKSVGEIVRLEYGKPLDGGDRKPDGQYPVYGANGEKDRTDKFYYDKPSIIIGRKGSAGEINLTEPKFWPLDVTYFITFDEQQHDLRFLYYLLTTLGLPSLAKGVKPGINRNEVYSQVTRIPLLPEQQRIAVKLDGLSTEIQRLESIFKQKLDALEMLKKSLLQQAFNGEL